MKSFNKRALASAVSLYALSVSANLFAQDEANSTDSAESKFEEVRVYGHPLSAEGLSQASAVLSGEELNRKLQGSIGATVAYEPGIHSATFGNAVGRPVIHGQSGPRVKVMEDRIDTLDVSVTSADHATTVEPFLADRVEILKGAGTLLYGSGAIGGVVDVHTGRIPHAVPDKPVAGRSEFRYADNADKWVGALRLDGGAGNFAWHIDGFARDADDYEIPGFAESARLRALEEEEHEHEEEEHEEEEHEEEEHDEEEEARDILPGSSLSVEGGAFGGSFIGESGFIGLAVSTLTAEYGLPGHAHEHGHEDEHEEEEHEGEEEHEEEEHGEEEEGNAMLDMEQTRVDIEAGLENPLPGFALANLRLAYNDYEHTEFEPDGGPGTTFDNEAWEARFEMVHGSIAGWEGAVGFIYSDKEFSAVGEEAFIAPVDTSNFGVFWVGENDLGPLSLELGFRAETLEHKPTGEDFEGVAYQDESFETFSASVGVVIPVMEGGLLSLHADYSSRAPVAEELYSEGPHLATQSYERGDASIEEEKAFNVSASFSYQSESLSVSATLYHINFSDYIYQFDTGLEEDELPLLQYAQTDATFTGFDAEASVRALDWDSGHLDVNAMFDTVVAELDDIVVNDNPPRLPPARFGIGFSGSAGIVDFSLNYLVAAEQSDNAEFELETDEYDDLRAYLGTKIELTDAEVTLFLQGRNLTDDEQRNHTSFIKDLAPAPGRTVEVGVRVVF